MNSDFSLLMKTLTNGHDESKIKVNLKPSVSFPEDKGQTMANMKDIAEKAGVSVTTVSKVLNKKGSISPEITKKILEIAKSLNYVPNFYARSLKMEKSRVIGIIAEDITVFNAAPIIDGIGARCEEEGYHYILENLRINNLKIMPDVNVNEYNDIVAESLDFMKSMQVDGIIFLGCHSHRVRTLPEIHNTNFVCAYCTSADSSIPSVMYDDKKAGKKAGLYLLNRGHKKIGIIAGPLSSIHTINRLAGFQEALYEKGVPYNPSLFRVGNWERDSGYGLAKELIAEKADAIFCLNDLMAVGAINACSQAGMNVGKEIAVMGFDNRDIAAVTNPALTSMAIPLYEIGYRSGDLVMDMINGKHLSGRENNVLLGCSIIERASTGAKKK